MAQGENGESNKAKQKKNCENKKPAKRKRERSTRENAKTRPGHIEMTLPYLCKLQYS